jgi:transposase, IS30 family
MKEFKHLDLQEREKIEKFLKKGKSLRFIAGTLDRSVSSVSDEIKNNSVGGIYNAKKADHKAYVKRQESKRDCLKVAMDADLQKFVIENITDDQSPEGISGRLKKVEKEIQYASCKAIYKFIASPHGRQIESHLFRNAVKKKSGKKRGISVGIDGRTFIDHRPKKVEKRLEFGHFEGDFIESGKDGTGSLLVVVERKTRYPFLAYLEDRSNANVNRLVEEMLRGIPVKSLTLDNDISFQKHEELSELLDAAIYFCHPQSPHEKGTVENRNKAIRRYVKKRSDLSKYPLEYFKMVETKLRTRFMTCLNFKTPQEEFKKDILRTKKPLACGILQERLLAN